MDTVTVIGDVGPVEQAIADELEAHHLAVHLVSTMTGWVRTARLTVANLDSPAGAAAVHDLAATDEEDGGVVVLCRAVDDDGLRDRCRQLCRECAATHAVTLVWHGAEPESERVDLGGRTAILGKLATTVVDRLTRLRRAAPRLDEVSIGVAA
jgi:hypothetical protein